MHYNKQQFTQTSPGTFTAEASTLGICGGDRMLAIEGSNYILCRVDKDVSGEDIAGWWYTPSMGAVERNPDIRRVLIIND